MTGFQNLLTFSRRSTIALVSLVALFRPLSRPVEASDPECGRSIVANYTLTHDIDCSDYTGGAALIIDADGVTLDGGGFRITANPSTRGVYAQFRANTTIKNLTVINASVAFDLQYITDGGSLENIHAHGSIYGLSAFSDTQDQSAPILTNVDVTGNTIGAALANFGDMDISPANLNISNNSGAGLYLNVTATIHDFDLDGGDNGSVAFNVYQGSRFIEDPVVIRNVTLSNYGIGIQSYCYDPELCGLLTIEDSQLASGSYGFYTDRSNVRIDNVVFTGMALLGGKILSSSDFVVTNSHFDNNTGTGLSIEYAQPMAAGDIQEIREVHAHGNNTGLVAFSATNGQAAPILTGVDVTGNETGADLRGFGDMDISPSNLNIASNSSAGLVINPAGNTTGATIHDFVLNGPGIGEAFLIYQGLRPLLHDAVVIQNVQLSGYSTPIDSYCYDPAVCEPLTIRGSSLTGGNHGFYLNRARVRIDNVTSSGMAVKGGVILSAKDFVVSNSSFANYGNNGTGLSIEYAQPMGPGDVQEIRNVHSNTNNVGFTFHAATTGQAAPFISALDVTNNPVGAYIQNVGGLVLGFGSMTFGNNSLGLQLLNVSNAFVSGLDFGPASAPQVGMGLEILNSRGTVNLEGLKIDNRNIALSLASAPNVTVTNSRFSNGYYALDLNNAANLRFYRNDVTGNTLPVYGAPDSLTYDLSYNGVGNFWGHTVAGRPCFFVNGGADLPYDANRTGITDTACRYSVNPQGLPIAAIEGIVYSHPSTAFNAANLAGAFDPLVDHSLPFRELELTDSASGMTRLALGDRQGRYTFGLSHPGDYVVRVIPKAGEVWTPPTRDVLDVVPGETRKDQDFVTPPKHDVGVTLSIRNYSDRLRAPCPGQTFEWCATYRNLGDFDETGALGELSWSPASRVTFQGITENSCHVPPSEPIYPPVTTQKGTTIQSDWTLPPLTYNSTAPVPISDLSTALSNIQVPAADNFQVGEVRVTVNIAHTFDGDLQISLIAPDGRSVVLSRSNGGSGNNYTNTVFDDDAGRAIASGNAPFTGSFRPQDPLASMNGIVANGTWTLKVDDRLTLDSGTLSNWELTLVPGILLPRTAECTVCVKLLVDTTIAPNANPCILLNLHPPVTLNALGQITLRSGNDDVTCNDNNANSSCNQSRLSKSVTCSCDPNDKHVQPQGCGAAGFIPPVTPLHYLVEFQNLGNAPARDVVLRDSLDEDLDLSTLQLLSTSHPLTDFSLGPDRLLTWTFLDIDLPDAASNEPGSHGFVSFSIMPRTGVAEGTTVQNYADIYFDSNAPVTTNTTLNTITYGALPIGGGTDPEICNGIDDDCDGMIDESPEAPDYCVSADSCLQPSVCSTGQCLDGAPINCDDANECTLDGCDPVSGCTHVPTSNAQTTCGVGACQVTADSCVDGVPQACTPGLPASANVVVRFDDMPMRYLANTSTSFLATMAWTGELFDDSTWSTGPKYGVGYDTDTGGPNALSLIKTSVPAGTFSVFTRARFTIPDTAALAAINSVFLSADYDDGYIAWINGVEVFSSPEMPLGTLSFNTNAASHESSNGTMPNYGSLQNVSLRALPVLHVGVNVLAIGVWNNGAPASTDLVLVPRLSLGEAEQCDKVDNDCNGAADEGFPDSDADGQADCVDLDDDNDSTLDASDCAPLNPSSSSGPPVEVQNVAWTGPARTPHLVWTSQGSGILYDVAGGLISQLRIPPGGSQGATCLPGGNDLGSAGFSDLRPMPPVGEGYYYIVRAQKSTCTPAHGSYGYASSGAERLPTSGCP